MRRVLVPWGTRPEIIKLAPVVRSLRDTGFQVRTLSTGQHGDPAMTDAFYEELGLRPDCQWQLDGDEDSRVGTILTLAGRELVAERPDVVLVLGDTNTVSLFCLAARRRQVPVAHLEAGLRSFNETSMEEVNRRVAAATASLHFAPTHLAARFLRSEGVAAERIRVVGNPVIDALGMLGVQRRPIADRRGAVVTTHRATNVDDPARLGRIVELVRALGTELAPVSFPLHPRTKARLEEARMLAAFDVPGVRLTPPLPYRQMMTLVADSRVVVTDSGGLQEEASWLGVPSVVLRRSTPRWEGVLSGASVLTGLDVDAAVRAATKLATPSEQARVGAIACPYGDGHSAIRVAKILAEPGSDALLRLHEPNGSALPFAC